MANPVSSLLVRIGADTSSLESGGRRASKSMEDLGSKAAELGKKLAVLGAAAAAAGAALATKLVKSGLSAVDSQAKLARSLDATVNGLRTVQLAAQNAGISADEMSGNLQRMNRRLGEMARTGAGPAAAWLGRLGLSAQELLKIPLEDRVAKISDAIAGLGTSAEQASAAFAIFGDAGIKMVPMLKDGSAAIRQAAQEVRDYGLGISQIDAAKVEMANDAMERIKLTIEAVSNRLAVAFAPILKVLADRFNQLARDNQGFGDVALKVAEWIVMAFAKVADVVQGLRVAFKGLQLILTGVWATLVTLAQAVVEVFAELADTINAPINVAIRGLNALGANIEEIPSIHSTPFAQGLYRFADEARNKVGEVRSELHDLAMQEMPSDRIMRFVEEVKAGAEEAARAVVAAQSVGIAEFGEDEKTLKEQERRQKELEAQRAALEAKLQMIREYAMTEEEEEIYRHEERMARLVEGLEAELITRQEFKELEAALEEQHIKRLTDIRKKGMTDLEKFTDASYSKQVGMISGYLADITAGVARENKAMFELNKAAGIANAIVSAHEGISKTLGAYPYPINLGLAAAHAVAAFAQVRAIAGQSFGGGGGAAPSLAGGTPATPVTPVTGGTPASAGGSGGVLTVEGVSADSLFSGRAVRELMDRIAEHIRDGGTVQFA